MKKGTHAQLQRVIQEGKPCFLIGNGINRFNQKKNEEDVSWEGLLLEIYNTFSSRPRNFIPEGIALTEFYDVIDLQHGEHLKSSLQEEFVRQLDWKPKSHHVDIVSKIKELNAPILTTNFDFVLQKASQSQMFRHRQKGLRLLSDYYPWDSYFSNQLQDDPFNSFSIWHMHGQKNYKRSIKLGLNQYLLMVDRAKRHFPTNKQDKGLSLYGTWLKPFFERDLIIMGLGLHEQEVFIRWLLLQRAKYFKRNPQEKRAGFYINHDESGPQNLGKKFFLKSVGFKYVDFIDDYNGFYEDFWDQF
jgi:hypothetical protein